MSRNILAMSVIAMAIAVPSISFAQTTPQPLTRAQVRADLVRIEQAGYRPGAADNSTYPADVQAAEAKVAAQENAGIAQAYGGVAQSGTADSGARAGAKAPAACVGLASFCNIYSGS
jgi:hypothetical protein